MTIEVTGTSTRNKGAELMLVAIREHFADQSDVQLAVDQFFGPYEERAQYGLLQKVSLNGWGRSRIAVELMPHEFRRAFGLVRGDDIDVLLDASGFAFGDQHPLSRTVGFARRVEQAKATGKTVILLPQALGPFEAPAMREAFGRIVDAADLVFARDDISMDHAQEATGAPDHLRQAPDFTNLVKPERTVQSDDAERVCVVPNQRMVEKAETPEEAAAYVPLIGRCIEAVEANGLQPVLLLHGRDDAELADDIQEHVGRVLPVHDESDPVELKRFLGESHLVIGSRFHALVGALSQGVPAVGTSWSHKYQMLFREYGCEDLLLSVHTDAEQVEACIEAAVGPERQELTVQIRQARDALIEETKAMWKEVDEVLEFTHKVGE
jgi:colanic acid/amylovoran biosynthesis protein